MELLTNEIRRRLPALYATEHERDPVAQVKFFSPWLNWTWYVTEFVLPRISMESPNGIL